MIDSVITIVGGCGHVGLPLGLAFASRGLKVHLLDVNKDAVSSINRQQVPFYEDGAAPLLRAHIGKELIATTDPGVIERSNVVVFVTGTPVDEHHNPRVQDVLSVINSYQKHMRKEQLVILRSTVFPGVVDLIGAQLQKLWGEANVAYCPERIVQGKGIEEIFKLPQIVSGTTPKARELAASLFSFIAPSIVNLEVKEAELAKLMTNSWRYIEFAIANQFYMMVEGQGLNFHKIYNALREDYPRASHYASPGLTAGPCLFKDTMQLSAFHKNNFFLGQSAMLVNEGLPSFLVDKMEKELGGLAGKKIAILGMTFKANNDDTRESLSFKLKKLLSFKMAEVICSDPHLPQSTTPLSAALTEADGVILGVPHNEYKKLKIDKPYVDCWGVWKNN